MNLRSLDRGREFRQHAGSQRQRMLEDHRLFCMFRRQVGQRDLWKATFFRTKAGPESRIYDCSDRFRVRFGCKVVFAHPARFGKLALEVLLDDGCYLLGCVICWVRTHELFVREECILIDEAKAIAPRIVRVERAFTPRTFHDIAGACAVHVFSRETVQLARALVKRFDIVDREIDVVRQRYRFHVDNALSSYVDEGQNHWTTIDVMTGAARNSPPAIAEPLAVKLRGLVEIVHLQNDPVECWSHFNSFHWSFNHRLTQMRTDWIMAPTSGLRIQVCSRVWILKSKSSPRQFG